MSREFFQIYFDVMVFLFGAAIGSFLNVCIYRMPREESLVSPPSHCPHCGTPIKWYHNIPLFTYLAIGGKCRYCSAKITPRYFLVELLTAVMFLAVWVHDNNNAQPWLGPAHWLLVAGLIAGTFIDFEHYIIPNEITFGGIIAGFALSFLLPGLHDTTSHLQGALRSFVGILTGGLTLFGVAEFGKLMFGRLKVELPEGTKFTIVDQKLIGPDGEMPFTEIFSRESDRVRFRAATLKFQDKEFTDVDVSASEQKIEVNGEQFELAQIGVVEATTNLVIIPREAMGLGDAKLLAAIGAFLGWQSTLFCVFASSVTGGMVSIVLIVLRQKDWQSKIPYGPYIAFSAVLWLFIGKAILTWYSQLFVG